MNIDNELIRHVADVARLELTDAEIATFQPQLKEILEAFSKLDEVQADDLKPSFHPVELKNALREDKSGECLPNETALANTTHKKDGYFKGPKVV